MPFQAACTVSDGLPLLNISMIQRCQRPYVLSLRTRRAASPCLMFMFTNHIKKAPEHGQFNHYYQKLKHLD